MTTSRRALWFAAAISVFVLAVVGTALTVDRSSGSEPSRLTTQQVAADHDAVATSRPVAEPSSFDLRQVHSRLLLLAWLGVLLVAALLARTAGRAIELRTLRSGSAVVARRHLDRGPPALAVV